MNNLEKQNSDSCISTVRINREYLHTLKMTQIDCYNDINGLQKYQEFIDKIYDQAEVNWETTEIRIRVFDKENIFKK